MSACCSSYPECKCHLDNPEYMDVCQAAMEQIKNHSKSDCGHLPAHQINVLVIDEEYIGRVALIEKIATHLTTTSTMTIEEAREYINGVVVISDLNKGDTIEKLKIEAEKLYADKVEDNYDYNEKAVIRQQRQENRYRAKHFRKL